MYNFMLLRKTSFQVNIIFYVFVLMSCKKETDVGIHHVQISDKPNIILVLADDVGYEVPTYTGGQSYSTPALDSLAATGIQFTQCQVCPNCSPTRIELMTGKYNFRNYKQWGVLNRDQKTIANMLQDVGYTTCVAGKWQFDGGNTSIRKFGFDKYRVWLPNKADGEDKQEKYRYKNPNLYENGHFLSQNLTNGKYADDMFVDYISNFIDENKDYSFFIYYPLSLCHMPFSPTPDDPEYAAWSPLSDPQDEKFFPSMVKYMDKEIKRVTDKVKAAGLADKTIIIFLTDNGTPSEITSVYKGKNTRGGKNKSTVYGTHVPLIVNWPGHIAAQQTSEGLIDATDFLPTIADIAGIQKPSDFGTLDGISFYPLLFGSQQRLRDWIYCYWDPGLYDRDNFKVWVQDENYKLYDITNNNNFYNISADSHELKPIPNNALTPEESARKQIFQSVLSQMHN